MNTAKQFLSGELAHIDVLAKMLASITAGRPYYLIDDVKEDANGNYECVFYDEAKSEVNASVTIKRDDFMAFLTEEGANHWEEYCDLSGCTRKHSCNVEDLIADPVFDKREYLQMYINRR